MKSEGTGPTDGFAGTPLFHNRNFVLFFVGQLVSNTGNWLQLAAQNSLVREITGSSLWVGVATAALFLPVLLFALPGGKLADIFDRRKMLVATQVLALVATAILAALAAAGRATVPAILVVAAAVGVQYAISIPTMMALLPSLVEPGQVGLAIGFNAITYNVARVLGPALATTLVVAIGFGTAFALNSLSFVALIAALLMMHPREESGEAQTDSGSIREALHYAWANKRIRSILAGVVTVSIAMDPVITLGPTFTTDYFNMSAASAGFLVSAFGIGAIMATFVATKGFRTHGAARFSVLLPWSLAYAAAMLGFAFSPGFLTAALCLALAGAGFLVTSTNWTAGLQEAVPDHMRGRVMGIWTLASIGSRPFAAVIDGAVADLVSPRAAVVLLVIPLVLVAVLIAPRLAKVTNRS